MNKFNLLLLSLCLVFATRVDADEANKLKLPDTEVLVNLHDSNDVSLYQYPATGNDLVIWVGTNGWQDRTIKMARDIAAKGIEVWQIDIRRGDINFRHMDIGRFYFTSNSFEHIDRARALLLCSQLVLIGKILFMKPNVIHSYI